jgi:hypothetical protein
VDVQQLPPLEHSAEPQQSLEDVQVWLMDLQGFLQMPDSQVEVPQHSLEDSQL